MGLVLAAHWAIFVCQSVKKTSQAVDRVNVSVIVSLIPLSSTSDPEVGGASVHLTRAAELLRGVRFKQDEDMNQTSPVVVGMFDGNGVGLSVDTAIESSVQRQLSLKLPQGYLAMRPTSAPQLNPAQEALRDPRSNTLKLTSKELTAISDGEIECIAWKRLPNGEIYRGPGHRQRVPGLEPNPINGKVVFECVP